MSVTSLSFSKQMLVKCLTPWKIKHVFCLTGIICLARSDKGAHSFHSSSTPNEIFRKVQQTVCSVFSSEFFPTSQDSMYPAATVMTYFRPDKIIAWTDWELKHALCHTSNIIHQKRGRTGTSFFINWFHKWYWHCRIHGFLARSWSITHIVSTNELDVFPSWYCMSNTYISISNSSSAAKWN